MTGLQIAFIIFGALGVLSVTMWAKFAAAYKELDGNWIRERRAMECHIESLEQEIEFWRRIHDSNVSSKIYGDD